MVAGDPTIAITSREVRGPSLQPAAWLDSVSESRYCTACRSASVVRFCRSAISCLPRCRDDLVDSASCSESHCGLCGHGLRCYRHRYPTTDVQLSRRGLSTRRAPDRSHVLIRGYLRGGSTAGCRMNGRRSDLQESCHTQAAMRPDEPLGERLCRSPFQQTRHNLALSDEPSTRGSHRPADRPSPRIESQSSSAGIRLSAEHAGNTVRISRGDTGARYNRQPSKYPSPCRATSDGSSRAGAVDAAPGSPIVAAVPHA